MCTLDQNVVSAAVTPQQLFIPRTCEEDAFASCIGRACVQPCAAVAHPRTCAMASAATEQQQEQSSSDDRRARFYEAKAQVASAISRQLKPPATAPGVSAGPDAALHPSLLNDASVIEPGLILSSWNVERSAELLQHLGVASVLQVSTYVCVHACLQEFSATTTTGPP